MFRRFSLFDSSPPSSRISINPPRNSKSDRKSSPLKVAIINTLQHQNSTILINDGKRSKSLDHSSNLRLIQNHSKQRTKSATLPPITNRQLPQAASPTSNRWYSRLGNSFRRGGWARSAPVQYQVNSFKISQSGNSKNFNYFK